MPLLSPINKSCRKLTPEMSMIGSGFLRDRLLEIPKDQNCVIFSVGSDFASYVTTGLSVAQCL